MFLLVKILMRVIQILIYDLISISVLDDEYQTGKLLKESGFEPMPIQDLNPKNLISSKKVNQWDSNLHCYKNMVGNLPAHLTTWP